mmetsp:Transcript_13122/g.38574  ORF Transcript_13122/g.38574 Transcript_13122/m.38574 type:complete len:182 (+) Transcript_13122:52-597(+)
MPARKKAPEPLLHFGPGGAVSLAAPVTDVDKLASRSDLSAFDTRAIPQSTRPKKTPAPAKWYDIDRAEMTRELKDDLQVVQMRDVIDRKRFYKSSDYKKGKLPDRVQVGTVIEGPTEYTSGRLTRKERKSNMVAELMGDETTRKYAKRKFLEVQHDTQRGGKRDLRMKAKGKKPKWARARH